MNVKGNHPLAEIIAKKLFGIEGDLPKDEKTKMVNRACKSAIEWHHKEMVTTKKDERPWGNFQIIQKEPGYWVKRIEVNPGARLSLQYHMGRSEEWIVVQGNGVVNNGINTDDVREGSHIHIEIGTSHRISNNSSLPLVFIEVALGTDLREDDIIRIKDDYGRENN